MATAKRAMNLTEEPDIVIWPETHYVFLEKIGPFQGHRTASVAKPAAARSCYIRTQQDYGIHEPVQDRAKDLSRGRVA